MAVEEEENETKQYFDKAIQSKMVNAWRRRSVIVVILLLIVTLLPTSSSPCFFPPPFPPPPPPLLRFLLLLLLLLFRFVWFTFFHSPFLVLFNFFMSFCHISLSFTTSEGRRSCARPAGSRRKRRCASAPSPLRPQTRRPCGAPAAAPNKAAAVV